MKTTVDLRGKPKHLNGQEIGTETLAQVAALALSQGNEGPPIKIWQISQELYSRGIVELDLDDLKMLRRTIEENKGLTIVAKAPILIVVEAALDKAEKKAKGESDGKHS